MGGHHQSFSRTFQGMRRESFGVGQRQSFHTVVSSGSGLFGASASVTARSLNPSKRVRSFTRFRSNGETYLVSILKRNSQLEFLVVPSHCLNCQSIVKVAGESLLLLKEFYSDNDLHQRGQATYFSLRKQSRMTQPQTGNVLEAMEGYLRYTNGGLLHPLLNDYPRLKEMQMGISERVNHDALEGIRLADRGFMYLNMSHGQPSHVIQILMRAPPLKHIILTRYGNAHVSYASDGNAVKDAFLRHAPTLEHLSTANCDFSKDILQAILCSSPNLRILETIEDDDENRPNKEVELDALRIIDSSWTCNQVEVFECKILNVPRPDIVITPLGDLSLVPPIPIPPPGPATAQDQVPLSGTMLVAQQESHAVQRRFLRQLGQLTHLRKLRLGKLYCDLGRPEYSQLEILGIRTVAVDAYFDTNCLELSLESGLDELAGLNQLEELDVALMAHWIGLTEVQWTLKNWPRLKIINGLKYRDFNAQVYGYAAGVAGSLGESGLEHVKWIRENRPDIQQC